MRFTISCGTTNRYIFDPVISGEGYRVENFHNLFSDHVDIKSFIDISRRDEDNIIGDRQAYIRLKSLIRWL